MENKIRNAIGSMHSILREIRMEKELKKYKKRKVNQLILWSWLLSHQPSHFPKATVVEPIYFPSLIDQAAQSIETEYRIDTKINCRIHVNSYLIKAAFEQIVKNSDEAKADKIKTEVIEEGNFVGVTISDNGKGLSRDHMRRVKDRMLNLERANVKFHDRAGLGLPIVKYVIENVQNGNFNIKSVGENKGFVNTITLPL